MKTLFLFKVSAWVLGELDSSDSLDLILMIEALIGCIIIAVAVILVVREINDYFFKKQVKNLKKEIDEMWVVLLNRASSASEKDNAMTKLISLHKGKIKLAEKKKSKYYIELFTESFSTELRRLQAYNSLSNLEQMFS